MNAAHHTRPKVFVAGATGLTGRFVVEHLAASGIPVIAHVRPDSPRLDEWSSRFEGMGARLSTVGWTLDELVSEFKSVAPTHVFGLLGTTRKRARRGGGNYEAVDYGLTAMLIEASLMLAQRPRFVYLSAVGVKEDSSSAYFQARAKVEAKLAAAALESVVARPSFILGARDDERPGEQYGAPVLDALLGVAGLLGARSLTEKYRSMSGDELAAGLVGLVADWPTEPVLYVPELRASAVRAKDRIRSRNEESEVSQRT